MPPSSESENGNYVLTDDGQVGKVESGSRRYYSPASS